MKNTKKLTFAALFLALGQVMPFLTMQIPEFGSMLLPMHIPILICGFVCGWKYGLCIGFICPLLRTLIFGMPPILTATTMAFELAAYGTLTGILYHVLKGKKFAIYMTLIISMILGRIVAAIVSFMLYGIIGTPFTLEMFLVGTIIQGVPGMILQLVLIPAVVTVLQKSKLVEN